MYQRVACNSPKVYAYLSTQCIGADDTLEHHVGIVNEFGCHAGSKDKNFLILPARRPLQTTAMFSPATSPLSSLSHGELKSTDIWSLSLSRYLHIVYQSHLTYAGPCPPTPKPNMYGHSLTSN